MITLKMSLHTPVLLTLTDLAPVGSALDPPMKVIVSIDLISLSVLSYCPNLATPYGNGAVLEVELSLKAMIHAVR